ncbi:MAG: hypothetical protein CO120_03745, partial [Gammaproteobacteria bacterium CG_4_9_14_3_um_filter_38_9]
TIAFAIAKPRPICFPIAFAFISVQAASVKKTSVSAADNSALIGNWVNVNSKTNGLDKLVIKQNAHGAVSIRREMAIW